MKVRAKNGSVPRYFDKGYKSSYQKMRDELVEKRELCESQKRDGLKLIEELAAAKDALRIEQQERALLIRWQDALLDRIRVALRLTGPDNGVLAHIIEDRMDEIDAKNARIAELEEELGKHKKS